MNEFEEVAHRLLANPPLHARFANTLSLLEYRGARKILKSQRTESISAGLLTHAAEEIRHAQVFKRLALRLSDGGLTDYRSGHLLCGREAHAYLQAVDDAGAELLGLRGTWQNYVLTTFLIEERAVATYPLYQ